MASDTAHEHERGEGYAAAMQTVGARIRWLRKRLGLSQEALAQDLARAIGTDISRGAIANWERGKGIRNENLLAVAQRFGVSIDWLTGNQSVPPSELTEPAIGVTHRVPTTMNPIAVAVVGVVQAGHFLVVGETGVMPPDERTYIASVPDPDFPRLTQYALQVVGDSVDKLCPSGGFAVCLPFPETGLELRAGMVVIANRERAGLVEQTVKVVRHNGRRFELHPASTNPAHKPIKFPSAEEHETVTVTGLVRRFVGPTLRW